MAFPHRLRHTPAVALFTVLLALFTVASPAFAEPTPAPTAPPDETGPPSLSTLRDNLAAAAAGFIKAETDLAASQAKQAELQQQLSIAEADIERAKGRVGSYAAQAYMTGRIGPLNMMMQATTDDDLLGRARVIESLTHNDQVRLTEFAEAKRRADAAKAGIDQQIAAQAVAVQEMALRKQAAEKAIAAAGGTKSRSDVDPATLPTANAAPRNSDGSWPSESCSVNDPTTSGCITARTLHALSETQRLGFGWYVSCYRPGNRYEHPKGRACDFAAFQNGFVNSSASGSNKVYGDRLAAFYVKNAKALGVMYVVWYCQIWQYGVGWHRYNSTGSNCGDSPAGDHTNHVHLSVF